MSAKAGLPVEGAGTTPGPRGEHPPVNRIIDWCKNITFLHLLLRMVITQRSVHRIPNFIVTKTFKKNNRKFAHILRLIAV